MLPQNRGDLIRVPQWAGADEGRRLQEPSADIVDLIQGPRREGWGDGLDGYGRGGVHEFAAEAVRNLSSCH